MILTGHAFGKKSPLQARALAAGYGATPILTDLDLDVPDGQLTVLLGPNGCGKSTLLRTMARLAAPMGGSVLLDGSDIHRLPTREVAKRLGLLPQSPAAPEGLRVRELVAQGRFPHQSLLRQWTTQDETAVARALAITGVEALAERPLGTLSGGQRQRCWIAMTLAQETPLILLDEPTTFLDLRYQLEILELMVQLTHRHGRTVVAVLHDLNQAAAHADNLVLLREGKVYAEGPPEAVFTAKNIEAVFGVACSILRDPASGHLLCAPARGGAVPVAQHQAVGP
ncbi:ATP-binding cassette domain-containing protein [Halomonas alkaliantarctica]|nr:ATP-binding cassette domain-containing protein [Halomonas alkaliantarctica]